MVISDKDKSGKKTYSTPVLRVYGDIRVITQATSMTITHHKDGAMVGNRKT